MDVGPNGLGTNVLEAADPVPALDEPGELAHQRFQPRQGLDAEGVLRA